MFSRVTRPNRLYITFGNETNFDLQQTTINSVQKVQFNSPRSVQISNRGNIDIVSLSVRLFDISGNPSGTTSSVTFTPVGTATNIVGKFELKSVPNVNSAPATLNIPVGTAKVEAIATIKVNGQNVVCSSAVRDKSFTPC